MNLKKIITASLVAVLSVTTVFSVGACQASAETVKDKINLIPDDVKLAIWGVGHHVSMLLANTRLEVKNIVRVYDSDKRKEGSKISGSSSNFSLSESVLSAECSDYDGNTHHSSIKLNNDISNQEGALTAE